MRRLPLGQGAHQRVVRKPDARWVPWYFVSGLGGWVALRCAVSARSGAEKIGGKDVRDDTETVAEHLCAQLGSRYQVHGHNLSQPSTLNG